MLNVSHPGLGAIRSLGRAGVPVVGLDPEASHAGFASRYCLAKTCPHPVSAPDDLLEFLVREGRGLAEPGVLSPASDGFALFVSRYRAVLGEYFGFNLPPPAVIEASVDKRKLYELADRHGLRHASTFYPEHLDDVRRLQHELAYPVYIKPYSSHLWHLAFPALGKGLKVFTPEELVAGFERVFAAGVQAMVQAIIAGPATNIGTVNSYLAAGGDALATLTTRKIRQWPVEFGRASLFESTHDVALGALGLGFFRAIGFRGFGTIEFKRDDRDGRLKLTDLNPRWVKPINLPIDSGVDFPLIHYLDLAGETPAPVLTYKAGVRWLDARGDFASALTAWRAGDLSPRAWSGSWLSARSFADFALDDLRPFLKEHQYGRQLARVPRYLWRYW